MTTTIWLAAVPLVALIVLAILVRTANLVRYIPNDQEGMVEKIFSRHGSVTSGFIALNGEAGFQPEILRGGLHFFFPFVYRIHTRPLVTIRQGEIGYIFARDGMPLAPSQTLAKNAADEDFLDVRRFLVNGGQKGPQRRLLREGTHAVNLAQFVVLTRDQIHSVGLDDIGKDALENMQHTIAERQGFEPVIIRDTQDVTGIVTVHDGPALESDDIIAPVVAGHENFQQIEAFLSAGGHRGRQLQALVEGTYFINRLFATIETIPKEIIEIGTVGVVVSYVGPRGEDKSAENYLHGELVGRGERGVWQDPLLPGKYAFNTYAGKIERVPTTNFVLKWDAAAEFSSHRLDDSLSEIALITKDAFEPILPLSVVLHINYEKAPELVQRFGDVRRLVEQTLDPMVSSYFKNVGQQKTLIELLQERDQIQKQAGRDMKERLAAYTLEFQEVLVGTPRPKSGDATIEQILVQLRFRQIAIEQQVTYESQRTAAQKERELNEAEAAAAAQQGLTQSAIDIQIRTNEGEAALARARKDADATRVAAQAEADKRRMEGEGEAAAVASVGAATAGAIDAQVKAYGGAEFRLAEQIAAKLFEAVAQGHQPIVPQVVVGADAGGGSAGGGLVAGLLAGLLPHGQPSTAGSVRARNGPTQ